ncbi:MAG: hypothetical protein QXF93_04470 [Saccharolobus sp.]
MIDKGYTVNYSSYKFEDSYLLSSYTSSTYLITEELIPINVTSINYSLNMIYYHNNWSLEINANLPNIFSI